MLKVGTSVIIERRQGEKRHRCKSKIVDLDDKVICINYPVDLETNRLIYLMNGEQVDISFIDDEYEQAYQFSSLVIGKRKENIPLIILSAPSEQDIVRIQRREFVRIHWPVDVAVHPLKNEFHPFNAITDDISAGGASILVPVDVPLHYNQQILCWFVLPRKSGEYHYLKFKCEIVRIFELNENSKIVSLQFLNKSKKDEQNLLQFCYEAQVTLKKKEMNI